MDSTIAGSMRLGFDLWETGKQIYKLAKLTTADQNHNTYSSSSPTVVLGGGGGLLDYTKYIWSLIPFYSHSQTIIRVPWLNGHSSHTISIVHSTGDDRLTEASKT